MGLFSSILSGFGGIAGDVLGAVSNASAVKKASKTQLAQQQAALAQQQAQYQQSRADYAPYLQAGTNALGQESALLGLTGNQVDWGAYVNANPDALADYQKYKDQISIEDYGADHYVNDGSRRDLSAFTSNPQQSSAIASLKASPLYTSLYGSGLDAINQSAAATGGLRGGNQALSQSNFGSSLLAQVIQQQLGNLGGISAQGLGATGNIASLGQANSAATSTNLTNQGNIQAGSILGQQGIYNNLSNQIQSTLSSVAGGGSGGGLGALLAQLTGGGGMAKSF